MPVAATTDASPDDLLDHDAELGDAQLLPRTRHSSQLRVDEPSNGTHVLPVDRGVERFRQVVQRNGAVDPELVIALTRDRRALLAVVLAIDLANGLFEHVLQGDQSRRPTKLVHHDGDVAGAVLEVPQLAHE
jgi:hypothetical protein